MEITPLAARKTRLDLTIRERAFSFQATLGPGVRVRCGTPLAPADGLWIPATGSTQPMAFAVAAAEGGDRVDAARFMLVDTHVQEFKAGDRLRIADVQDSGALTFEKDEGGRYLAYGPSLVLLA